MVSTDALNSYEFNPKPLGVGGFGAVHEAYHKTLGRKTALKFLTAQNEKAMQQLIAMFLSEARILAALNDDHFVKIYDVFPSDLGPCIAMEFLEGGSLQDLIDCEIEFANSEIAELFACIVEGVEVMHSVGVVHRDLKPANILLRSDGDVVISDFGLAFLNSVEALSTRASSAGTFPYMSPEQYVGKGVDPQSDLWALGVILYQLYTGRLPFLGESIPEIMHKIINCIYTPIDADAPKWVREVVQGLLQVDKAQRFQCCDDIRRRLPVNKSVTNSEDLNPDELLQVLLKVLPSKGTRINREEIIRQAARQLGIKRVGNRVRHKFLLAITRGVRRNLVERVDIETIARM